MNKQVFFVHGGGTGAHREDKGLAESVQDVGADCHVQYPQMPEDRPEYKAWRATTARELAALGDGALLVGRSSGASLLNALSEETPETSVKGVFLIATPFWGTEDLRVAEYTLREDFASGLPKKLPLLLYFSRDNEMVLFEPLALCREKLLQTTVRAFKERGHPCSDNLSDVGIHKRVVKR